MNVRALQSCSRLFLQRGITTSRKNFRTMEEFKELQRQMQVDDGVPVFLKKGPTDKLIFAGIVMGAAFCLEEALRFVYGVIYPPKAPSA